MLPLLNTSLVQGYAWEITTREGGWGLDSMLRGRNFVLNGVTNGIDVDEWNPATDKQIAANFSVDDLSGKVRCPSPMHPLLYFLTPTCWTLDPLHPSSQRPSLCSLLPSAMRTEKGYQGRCPEHCWVMFVRVPLGEGQAACKAALQRELGLAERPDVPLIGFIGRLDWQKGPDVIQAGLPELMTDDVQFVSHLPFPGPQPATVACSRMT